MDALEIYRNHAREYDRLVLAEDADGNLLPALSSLAPLRGKAVLEVGVGTGRLTRLLVSAGARVVGFERAPAMLDVAREHFARIPEADCTLDVADAEDLPVDSNWADVAIAGWVFGHFRCWMPEDWKTRAGRAIAHMNRALRTGGTLVIIETLGTGSTEPAPPSVALGEYYAWLEDDHRFARKAIRTDYQFGSMDDAAKITGFFFGDEFGEKVLSNAWSRVPECTGIWSRTKVP